MCSKIYLWGKMHCGPTDVLFLYHRLDECCKWENVQHYVLNCGHALDVTDDCKDHDGVRSMFLASQGNHAIYASNWLLGLQTP